MEKLKVAVVQAAPVLFDRDATLAKIEGLTGEATAGGANLVLFPEAMVSAYPRGLDFGVSVGGRTEAGRQLFQRYHTSSLAIPGPGVDFLGRIARENGVFLAVGVIEREAAVGSGTLYCTLLIFGPDGALLNKHRKLKPTAAERFIWGEGDGSGLRVVDTPWGGVGGLICWENYMPLARTALYQQGLNLYLAPTADARDSWRASMIHIACEGRCFVLSCNQYVSRDMVPAELLPQLLLEGEVLCSGGSMIVSPMGNILAGPVHGRETILFADLDLAELVRARFDFDPVGHYSRPDIFRLGIRGQDEGI